MSKLPLIDGVLKYAKENNISFCMPGHKGGRGFSRTKEGREFIRRFIECDITEVDGVDNLHNAEGIIKESGELLSRFYGSKKSYFLVNGSTSGNLAMIYSCFEEGDKIIAERNCHRSIFNGIIMRKLRPVYIKNKIYERFNAPLAVDMEHFLRIISENDDAKGIIITYPNYYGICCNLKFIIDTAHKLGMKVIVDCAHGAHFGIYEKLPENPLKLGADMVVMSSHKTLPSLTQTAFLHIGQDSDVDIERVDFYVSAFLTTSPSYLFLCSMDYARFYLEKYGTDEYKKLLLLTDKYKNKINEIENMHVIGIEDISSFNSQGYDLKNNNMLRNIQHIDNSRFVLNLKKGYNAYSLMNHLRKKGIQCEFCDGSNIVMIFSPFNNEEEFEKLFRELDKCDITRFKDKKTEIINVEIPEQKYIPAVVLDRKKVWVDINKSEGKVCGESIVPYPPGVPMVMAGEVINKEIIKAVNYYTQNNVNILGIKDRNVLVIDD